jgi:Pentapeptide repeats (8 copies)
MSTNQSNSNNQQPTNTPEPQEEDIRKRAEEIWKYRGKGNDKENWHAAIEELKLEDSIRGKIKRTLTYPQRLTQKILLPFGHTKHRFFALETTKTVISGMSVIISGMSVIISGMSIFISGMSVIATICGGYVLYLNFKNADERLITERFYKAVEQVSSNKIETRVGGIYALESISKDSDKYYKIVIEFLADFVQEHTNLPSDKSIKIILQKDALDKKTPDQTKREGGFSPFSRDIQAALKVLSRRAYHSDEVALNLREIKLRDADLRKANLRKVDFQQADLREADFQEADLQQADFGCSKIDNKTCTNLKGAKNLTMTQIKKANNWQQACYSPYIRTSLGLPAENPKHCAGEERSN